MAGRGRPRIHPNQADKQYEYRKRRADELLELRSAAHQAEALIATLTNNDPAYTDRNIPLYRRLADLTFSADPLPAFRRQR